MVSRGNRSGYERARANDAGPVASRVTEIRSARRTRTRRMAPPTFPQTDMTLAELNEAFHKLMHQLEQDNQND